MSSVTKGERTRAAILDRAAGLSTVVGLESLSIGELAKATGMSKSGLYAHFGSKEELQLATVERAEQIFRDEVIGPGRSQPPGAGRLLALCEAFLSYVERGVFPGGCFFSATAAEVSAHPGRVHDEVAKFVADWIELLEESARDAREEGDLAPGADAAQLAFELYSLTSGANNAFVLSGEQAVLERARRAVRERVDQAAPAES